MQSSKVTLTTAQILALDATPIELAPAPGPGKIIIPIGVVAVLHAGATPFAAGSSVHAFIGLEADAHDQEAFTAAFVNAAADAAAESIFMSSADTDILADYENKAINLVAVGAAFTTGDGSLTVTLFYNTALTS